MNQCTNGMYRRKNFFLHELKHGFARNFGIVADEIVVERSGCIAAAAAASVRSHARLQSWRNGCVNCSAEASDASPQNNRR